LVWGFHFVDLAELNGAAGLRSSQATESHRKMREMLQKAKTVQLAARGD
jgi:hypothetical protein